MKLTVNPETEEQFMSWVIEFAHLHGWLAAHFRPARIVKDGTVSYRTAVSADGSGFPDLVLVRAKHKGFGNQVTEIIFAEIKSETGKLTSEQKEWRDILDDGLRDYWYLWRPSDRAKIEEILR